MEKWEEACEVVFDLLNFHRYEWMEMTDSKKKIILDSVYDITSGAGQCRNGKVDSGLVSKEAMEKKNRVEDHFISPRSSGRAIMDDNQHILDDFEEFKKIFRSAQTVVHITSSQNMNMRYSHHSGVIRIFQLTKDKYNEIKFWSEKTDEWVVGFPLAKEIPEWFTDFERKYLIRG